MLDSVCFEYSLPEIMLNLTVVHGFNDMPSVASPHASQSTGFRARLFDSQFSS